MESEDESENDFAECMIEAPEDGTLEIDAIKDILHKSLMNDVDIEEEKDDVIENESIDSMEWPGHSDKPVNEFEAESLAAKCFPTLFANGIGDPTNNRRRRPIKFAAACRHLLKYAYKKSDDTWFYPFAAHPRFAFWALSYLQRKRAMESANVCLINNPY